MCQRVLLMMISQNSSTSLPSSSRVENASLLGGLEASDMVVSGEGRVKGYVMQLSHVNPINQTSPNFQDINY